MCIRDSGCTGRCAASVGVGCAVEGFGSGSNGLRATGGNCAVSAPIGLTMPKPVAASRPGSAMSFAVLINALTTSLAGISGCFARTSAATPDTIADAALVPSISA